MQTPWARREDAAKTQWRLHRLREVSVQTPPPPAAFLRRPCASSLRAHGVPVVLWETSLRCYCAVTATPRRSYGAHSDRSGNAEPRRALCACSKCAPWHGVLGDPTASSGDVTAMPRRCHGTLGDPTVCTSAFWNFLGRRAIAVRTPPWCDRGINFNGCTGAVETSVTFQSDGKTVNTNVARDLTTTYNNVGYYILKRAPDRYISSYYDFFYRPTQWNLARCKSFTWFAPGWSA